MGRCKLEERGHARHAGMLLGRQQEVLDRVETGYEPVLRSWDGMMVSVEGSGAFLDELLGTQAPGNRR